MTRLDAWKHLREAIERDQLRIYMPSERIIMDDLEDDEPVDTEARRRLIDEYYSQIFGNLHQHQRAIFESFGMRLDPTLGPELAGLQRVRTIYPDGSESRPIDPEFWLPLKPRPRRSRWARVALQLAPEPRLRGNEIHWMVQDDIP